MGILWTCEWQIAPGQYYSTVKNFKSFTAAKRFARELICEKVDFSYFIKLIRGGTAKKEYRQAVADFYEKFFTDPTFPKTKNDIPKEKDYPESEDHSDEEGYFDSLDEIDFVSVGQKIISIDECIYNFPSLYSDMVFMKDPLYEYSFDIYFENIIGTEYTPPFKDMSIRLYPRLTPGPLFLLNELSYSIPRTYKEIIEKGGIGYSEKYEIECYGMERTLRRYVAALRRVGFNVISGKNGLMLGPPSPPIKDPKRYGKTEYPLMILRILMDCEGKPKQADIIKKVEETFGVTMHRKTVSKCMKEINEYGKWMVSRHKSEEKEENN